MESPYMATVTRIDRGELKKPERLANGWLRVDGYIARPGILEYVRADGTVWREYRPPEEAFAPEALDSFALVPLTNNHPPGGLLTSDNTKDFQVGTVEAPRQDGDKVRARMLVTDPAAIAALEAGRVELSCGYSADVAMVPGEIDGQRYDAVQRNVRGNHVALVDQGRAGPQFRVRMDGAFVLLDKVSDTGQDSPTQADSNKIGVEDKMLKIRIDGVECEVSETAAQLIAKSEKAANETIQKYAADAKAAGETAEKATARADALDAELKKAKAELADAPKKAREAITARVALETKAAKVLPDEKFDGKSDLEVKRAVAEHVHGIKMDGKAEAYVEAMFDLAVAKATEEQADDAVKTAPIERADGGEDSAALMAKMKERSRSAYKTKVDA